MNVVLEIVLISAFLVFWVGLFAYAFMWVCSVCMLFGVTMPQMARAAVVFDPEYFQTMIRRGAIAGAWVLFPGLAVLSVYWLW